VLDGFAIARSRDRGLATNSPSAFNALAKAHCRGSIPSMIMAFYRLRAFQFRVIAQRRAAQRRSGFASRLAAHHGRGPRRGAIAGSRRNTLRRAKRWITLERFNQKSSRFSRLI
jgi:hypothetical protein